MSVADLLRRLRPGQYPGLRLGERHVVDLVKARANPLPKYRLARVLLRYSPDKEAALSTLERELVLVEAEAGSALERQRFVDLVRDLAVMATSRPGVYSIVMLSSTGYAFGTIVSESVPTPSVGASAPDAPSPTAPMRIVLATVADAARAAREVAAREELVAAEEVLRRR